MPKKAKPEKPVTEMTTEELADKVFPKVVKEHLKELAERPAQSSQKKV
ncbi:MAG: hypothetical protein HYU30_10465 [Chloroflexi bacterium]|nr:hypothetical protein [Chloroflexota bacterium]